MLAFTSRIDFVVIQAKLIPKSHHLIPLAGVHRDIKIMQDFLFLSYRLQTLKNEEFRDPFEANKVNYQFPYCSNSVYREDEVCASWLTHRRKKGSSRFS